MSEKETFLLDKIGVKICKEVETKWVYFKDEEIFVVSGTTQIFDNVGKNEIIARTKSGEPSAFIRRIGKGKVIVVGFGINHTFDYHISLVDKIIKLAGVKRRIQVEPFSDIIAVLRENETFGFLYVFNYHEVDKKVVISLSLPGEKNKTRIPSIGNTQMRLRSSMVLPLNIPLKENIILRYSSIEILKYLRSKNKLSFSINDNVSSGELCLKISKRPKKVESNASTKWQYENGILKIFVSEIQAGKDNYLTITL